MCRALAARTTPADGWRKRRSLRRLFNRHPSRGSSANFPVKSARAGLPVESAAEFVVSSPEPSRSLPRQKAALACPEIARLMMPSVTIPAERFDNDEDKQHPTADHPSFGIADGFPFELRCVALGTRPGDAGPRPGRSFRRGTGEASACGEGIIENFLTVLGGFPHGEKREN